MINSQIENSDLTIPANNNEIFPLVYPSGSAKSNSLRERRESESNRKNGNANFDWIIGQSMALKAVLDKVKLVGPTDANVLILGESGSGKEVIAKAIHGCSLRVNRPFVKVNCSAIPKDLFESEFFGHVKGAFTGALQDRKGRFEQADGGTILLDEIGDIPLELQSKLLRVLQEGEFERLGDRKSKTVDVRVISATNKNLQKEVQAGRFREDLYFRLNVVPIEAPPLRDRLDDIPVLTDYFLTRICEKNRCEKPQMNPEQTMKLQAYHWPGNIRELENIVERAVILSTNGRLNFDLPQGINPEPTNNITREDERRKHESANILAALEKTNGKIYGENGAANLLGLKPTTLASRLKSLGITRKAHSRSGQDHFSMHASA